MSAYVSIHQHTSAYVSIRQHASEVHYTCLPGQSQNAHKEAEDVLPSLLQKEIKNIFEYCGYTANQPQQRELTF
jgi:hypothetical protein